jgi:uncharacterized membrane protein
MSSFDAESAGVMAQKAASHMSLLHLHLTGPPPWLFPIVCGIFGYSCCGVGLGIVKLSHAKMASSVSSSFTSRVRPASAQAANILWLVGLLVNALGGLANMAALRYGPQTALAPLSSVALVANAIFATVVLGERFSPAVDALPMALIASGNVLAVSSASHAAQNPLTLAQITALALRPSFLRYLAVVFVASSFLMILRARIRRQIRRSGGIDFASPTLVARAGLCHTAAAAMLAVNTVLLAKASVLALADGFANAYSVQFIVIVCAWLALGLFWLRSLNTLISQYDVLFIVPAIEVLWSLCSMISGGLFFEEFEVMPALHRASFACGVLINFWGIMLLASREERKSCLSKLG